MYEKMRKTGAWRWVGADSMAMGNNAVLILGTALRSNMNTWNMFKWQWWWWHHLLYRGIKKKCCLLILGGLPHSSAIELLHSPRGHKGKGQEVTGKWVSSKHIYISKYLALGVHLTQFHEDRENVCCVYSGITNVMVLQYGWTSGGMFWKHRHILTPITGDFDLEGFAGVCSSEVLNCSIGVLMRITNQKPLPCCEIQALVHAKTW